MPRHDRLFKHIVGRASALRICKTILPKTTKP